ncbi:MAG: hypothetical protein ACXVRH_06415 [Thermoleophilaceae bacterium]
MKERYGSLDSLNPERSLLTVSCQDNERMLTGGFTSYGAIVTESWPNYDLSGSDSWSVVAKPDGTTTSPYVAVHVYCVPAG